MTQKLERFQRFLVTFFALFSVVLITGDLGSDSFQSYVYIENGNIHVKLFRENTVTSSFQTLDKKLRKGKRRNETIKGVLLKRKLYKSTFAEIRICCCYYGLVVSCILHRQSNSFFSFNIMNRIKICEKERWFSDGSLTRLLGRQKVSCKQKQAETNVFSTEINFGLAKWQQETQSK